MRSLGFEDLMDIAFKARKKKDKKTYENFTCWTRTDN